MGVRKRVLQERREALVVRDPQKENPSPASATTSAGHAPAASVWTQRSPFLSLPQQTQRVPSARLGRVSQLVRLAAQWKQHRQQQQLQHCRCTF